MANSYSRVIPKLMVIGMVLLGIEHILVLPIYGDERLDQFGCVRAVACRLSTGDEMGINANSHRLKSCLSGGNILEGSTPNL